MAPRNGLLKYGSIGMKTRTSIMCKNKRINPKDFIQNIYIFFMNINNGEKKFSH